MAKQSVARKKPAKKRRGSFLKIRKGRGQDATWYIVDTFGRGDEVLHSGIKSREEADRMLRKLKEEDEYRAWVF